MAVLSITQGTSGLATFLKSKSFVSFLCGLPLFLAYAPYSFWPLTFVCLTLFLAINLKTDIKQATKSGFSFGLGWFASGISWVHVSIDQFGGLPLIVSLLLMLLLCCYLAIYPALAMYFSKKVEARFLKFNKGNWLWLFPSFFIISEFLRGNILTGFPWLSFGYSQIESPLRSLAPIIGETGITFMVCLTSVALVKLITKSQIKGACIVLITLILTMVISAQQSWVTPTGKTIKTALVQGNIAQELKWNPDMEWPTMLKYMDLSRPYYDADIILWPEAAVPAVEPLAQEFLENTNKAAALNQTAIITGIINYNFESKHFFNGLIVLGKKHPEQSEGDYYYRNPNHYYKHHLLPIGEFVPFGDLLRPIAPLFNLPMSSFSRGDYVQANLQANGVNILPLICFEVAFANQLSANFTSNTELLLTVSNDTWFGNSHGPHQHLEIAQFRALEFARPMLRGTNNGVTAIIDHKGKLTHQLPQFTESVLSGDVQLVSGETPYSIYGNWIVLALLLLGFTPLLVTSTRK